jgi:hypothetical protein
MSGRVACLNRIVPGRLRERSTHLDSATQECPCETQCRQGVIGGGHNARVLGRNPERPQELRAADAEILMGDL